MIEIQNISKQFDGRVILEDISAVMEAGKCNLIIGTSGSGKTVLTKCMVGLFCPDNGAILYSGENMMKMENDQRRLVCYSREPLCLIP